MPNVHALQTRQAIIEINACLFIINEIMSMG